MKVVVGWRGTGKTTRLLKEAAKIKGCIVIVPTEQQKRLTREHARSLGLNVEIQSIEAVKNGHLRGRYDISVAVDDADWIIQRFFGHVKVRIASITDEGNAPQPETR